MAQGGTARERLGIAAGRAGMAFWLSLLMAGCGGESHGNGGTTCGDGLCEASERESCPADCSGGVDGGGATCTVGGVDYDPGVTFPAGDGCNTCTCGADGGVACTEAACNPEDGCRTDEDCPVGYCAPSGSSGTTCGIPCGLEPCGSHEDCTSGGDEQVCHRARFEPYEPCCDSPTSASGRCGQRCDDGATGSTSCAEGNRCAADGACEPIPCSEGYECPDGTRCAPGAEQSDAHDCEPIPCAEGYECPSFTTCDPSTPGHGCQRMTCETDGDCEPSGYCVLGACYESLGICEQPVP